MMEKNEHVVTETGREADDVNGSCELNDKNNDLDQSSPTRFPSDSSKCETLSTSVPVNKKIKTVTEDVKVLNSQCVSAGMQAPLLLMAGQHGILPPQIQQILRQIPGSDLQLILQQQQSMILQHQQQQQKLQEGLLHQLNEQLQVNFIQLSQLVQQQQQNEKKSCKQTQQQIQQLGVQQQQLLQQIQQIQLTQRQYLMAYLSPQLGALHQGMMSPDEIQQLWKEVSEQSGIEEKMVKKNNIDISSPSSTTLSQSNLQNGHFLTNGNIPNDHNLLSGGSLSRPPVSILHNDSPIKPKPSDQDGVEKNSLYRHNFCKWPGCDTHCEDFKAFIKHINHEHILDDKSTAQARVQSQVVSQLEMQLAREKELLQGMMQHLHVHMNQPMSVSPSVLHNFIPTSSNSTPVHNDVSCLETNSKLLCYQNPPTLSQQDDGLPSLPTAVPTALPVSITSLPLPSPSMTLTIPATSTVQLAHSPSNSSLNNVTTSSSGPMRRRVSDKCNLPISAEIQRNRDFYKHTDVRPPFTYASLIRQSIIESPHRQLTLNEIYQWFQNTFSYFRRNEATWKNAVRHNLSLHKCFMRVENVKGAVWTVDEIEFYRRRPQKLSGAMKSPTYSDHSPFNESFNTSLQAAIGESGFSIMSNSTGTQDSAEDLSMKISEQDELYREEQMFKTVKQEIEESGLSDDQHTDRQQTVHQAEDLEEEVLEDENIEMEAYTNSSTSENNKWNFSLDSKCKNTIDQHNNKTTSKSEDLKSDNEILENLGRFSHVSQDMVLSVPPSVV